MSRLEAAAKPILTALMGEDRQLRSLSPSEATVVGKWAAKTAYLHAQTGPMKEPVENSHLRRLRGDSGSPMPGVGVFGMQGQYMKPTGYIQGGCWPQFVRGESAPDRQTPSEAYKVGLQYRHLYLLVAFWPGRRSVFMPVSGIHIRLFPATRSPGPEYSAKLAIGDGPIDRLAAFADALGVLHL